MPTRSFPDGGVEEPTSGGSVSRPVRVGVTVRRPVERWSPAVWGLLEHLEAVGFEGAPRFLGVDSQGREVLTWIEGTPALRPWPGPLLQEEGLVAFAELLRDYHEAVASYRPPPDAEWWTGVRELVGGETVVHGDLGPWNTIWREGRPVGFIDWDFAEPAPPIADVAEAAFFVVPMREDAHTLECGFSTPPDRDRRLRVFCEACGIADTEAVLDRMENYWETEDERTAVLGAAGVHPWAGFYERGLLDGYRDLLAWLRRYRAAGRER